MIESHAVLEVSDGILDLGVTAVVGLQIQGIPVPVGDGDGPSDGNCKKSKVVEGVKPCGRMDSL